MIEIIPSISAKWGQRSGEAARYLEQVVQEQAVAGWEFQRIDSFLVVENIGCGCLAFFMTLFNKASIKETRIYVATFRSGSPTATVSSSPETAPT